VGAWGLYVTCSEGEDEVELEDVQVFREGWLERGTSENFLPWRAAIVESEPTAGWSMRRPASVDDMVRSTPLPPAIVVVGGHAPPPRPPTPPVRSRLASDDGPCAPYPDRPLVHLDPDRDLTSSSSTPGWYLNVPERVQAGLTASHSASPCPADTHPRRCRGRCCARLISCSRWAER
jgi:hypothetical protein